MGSLSPRTFGGQLVTEGGGLWRHVQQRETLKISTEVDQDRIPCSTDQCCRIVQQGAKFVGRFYLTVGEALSVLKATTAAEAPARVQPYFQRIKNLPTLQRIGQNGENVENTFDKSLPGLRQ